jgi:hypothetical protein
MVCIGGEISLKIRDMCDDFCYKDKDIVCRENLYHNLGVKRLELTLLRGGLDKYLRNPCEYAVRISVPILLAIQDRPVTGSHSVPALPVPAAKLIQNCIFFQNAMLQVIPNTMFNLTQTLIMCLTVFLRKPA